MAVIHAIEPSLPDVKPTEEITNIRERLRMKTLSVSILSADFGELTREVQAVEAAGADWIHVDVMDGHFVPNITIGPDVVRAIRKATDLPLDVHLMVSNPERYLKDFADAGADWLGIHVEATSHVHRAIQQIRELGVRPCITLNPATSLSSLEYILSEVDMVLLMTVNPGFGGQRFIEATLPKIHQCRRMIDLQKRPVLLEVDGGVSVETVARLSKAGANVFVSGSAVFQGNNYAANIAALRALMG
jgi:ribulose-phosphate 3-epimerase